MEKATETAQELDGRSGDAPPVPLDVRDEVRRVVDAQESSAERNAALIKIWYELNGSEVGALEMHHGRRMLRENRAARAKERHHEPPAQEERRSGRRSHIPVRRSGRLSRTWRQHHG